MRAWILTALLLIACTEEGGPTAALVLRFEAEETFVATERIEVTVYDSVDGADHCLEVFASPTTILAGMPIVAGPFSAPITQVSNLAIERVSWGSRLFWVTAHTADAQQIARGCTTEDILPSGTSVTVVMERTACSGADAYPCGPDSVCRNGTQCEDRACRIEGDVVLRDFTSAYTVGAQQVVATDEGILVAWSGFVGVSRGVAIAHLSDDLSQLGETRIIEGDPATWPALAPTTDGFILAWADYGPEEDQRAIVRTISLDKGGAPSGAQDEVTLTFAGDYAAEDYADWNTPGLFRLVPTSMGAVAIWYEYASADANPETGPWQVTVVAMDETGAFTEQPHALDYPSAFHYETARGTGDGAAIEFIVATGECRLATIAADGRVISDEALTGGLESCATVTFGPTRDGYTFLAQESRRLMPWPAGAPSDPLILPPDEPLTAAVWGTFTQAGDRLYVGWEEHSADDLTSRINVAVLDERGVPTGPGVPFPEMTGEGPYFGFSMTAAEDALYAAWYEGPEQGNRIAVSRIVCD